MAARNYPLAPIACTIRGTGVLGLTRLDMTPRVWVGAEGMSRGSGVVRGPGRAGSAGAEGRGGLVPPAV